MHDARVHTKRILARGQKGFKANPANYRRKKNYPSNDLALRRAKYYERRDHFRAMGLDAKGKPFKSKWGRELSDHIARKRQTQTNPHSLDNLKLGRRWSPERKARHSRIMRKRARQKAMALARYGSGAQMFEAGGKPPSHKRIQFVYPIPGPEPTIAETTTNIRKVRYCPFCGEHIEKHLYETP